MSSRGGARQGAGRKKGEPNKATAKRLALQSYAEKHGLSPLEIMLENMRHFHKAAADAEAVLHGLTAEEFYGRPIVKPEDQFKALLAEVKKVAGLRSMAQDCARDAAQYLHHKLASVEHTGVDGGPIKVIVGGDDSDLV